MIVNAIAIVNRSHVPDVQIQIVVEAYRSYMPAVCAAWDRPLPGLTFYGWGHVQRIAEEAALYIVDSAGDPHAFGAHTMFGTAVWGYVDANLCAADNEPISRVVGHELIEATVNPTLQLWSNPLLSDGDEVALEPCDPVQRQSTRMMTSTLGNAGIVELSDFVLPSFYDVSAKPPYSYQDTIAAPLVENPGGYKIIRRDGGVMLSGREGVRVTGFGRTVRILTGG